MKLTPKLIAELIILSNNTRGIEVSSGATTLTGAGISIFRILALRSALSLEAKGMRMSRGRSALSVARKQYGIKAGTAARAHAILSEMIEEGHSLAEEAAFIAAASREPKVRNGRRR